MTQYTLPVVGMHFRPPAKPILANLPSGAILRLAPEPTNPYDPNAVAVFVPTEEIPESQHQALDLSAGPFGFTLDQILEQDSWHLGYIPKVDAQGIAPVLSDFLDRKFLEDAERDNFISGTLSFSPEGKPQVTFDL
jgi:HIRAN domain